MFERIKHQITIFPFRSRALVKLKPSRISHTRPWWHPFVVNTEEQVKFARAAQISNMMELCNLKKSMYPKTSTLIYVVRLFTHTHPV